ncbi:MAG: hypothetical protein DRR04_08985 [Gammaproteobacteria bacterium]|nr:MAG: hypothetical protein DRQ97_04035 [Gammaproteobacteria bacterium]RLA59246.1 MAG: hypothetical protein DRR04_08985 [Gammaproteobacteria bacterium]
MGVFNRLLRRGAARADFRELDIEAAQKIVQDYRIFLETCAPLPGRVADVSELPHSKNRIKDAFSVCITAIRDPALTEHLKHGYLMLSAWQVGVGTKTLGPDFTQLDLDIDPLELAHQIQQQSAPMEKWSPVIKADQAQLTSELDALGVHFDCP